MKTLANRYEQEKRWAWGVTDVGYVLKRFFLTPHIGTWQKLKKLFLLLRLIFSGQHLFYFDDQRLNPTFDQSFI